MTVKPHLVATMALLLGLVSGIQKRDVPLNSIAIEEAGVILKTKGMVTMTNENLLLSVFKKIDMPKIKVVDCEKTICSRSRGRFRCTHPTGYNFTHSRGHWTQQHLREITEEYVAEYKLVRSSFSSQLTEQGRRPRRFAAFLAAGLSLLTSAFTGVSTYTLSKHISDLRHQFNNFKTDLSSLRGDLIKVHEGVLLMFDEFSTQLEHKLSYLSCELQKDIHELASMEMTTRWEVQLDKVFRLQKSGVITGQLTPGDLPLEHVKHLIANHKELQPLVYGRDPARMYSLVEVALVNANITGDSLNVHLVLHIPRVTDDNTWPLLEVSQVGVSTGDECFNIKHSELAVMINGELKQLEKEHCTILSNHLSTCMMQETSKLLPSCLLNLQNCTLERKRCGPKTLYDAKGLMVVGAQVFTISKQQEITTRRTSLKPAFYPWEEYVQIQVEGITFEAPTFSPERVEVEFDIRDDINFSTFDWSFDIEDQMNIQEPLPIYTKNSLKSLNIVSFALSLSMVVVFLVIVAVYFRQGLINLIKKDSATTDPEAATDQEATPDTGTRHSSQYRQ
jgi:hypothetical protein